MPAIPQETIDRCLAVRKAYRELELKYHDKEWSIEEDLLALTNDIGNMNRLIMTKQGRYYDETPYTLEHKMAENIWWLIELADRLDIDIQKEMETFLAQKEELLGIKK
ncbi:MazG-like protein [Streptococcus suis]|uniref:30S ribosomal protein S15 n=1 Tax=Streptococcus suis TaxID=1307 RepID=A0A0Z8FM25_STRSU|nr:MazG-like protein [Streptococcus suis]NQH95083.1 MazG-like protein [Streptococcus suis]CYU82675.1 30S ribosomal protein S15 [Streptococcus suis]HEL2001709.1 MazG-like protein [Streptococcus suis]HEL2200673.1 MazG-like protein [Streptococcus suis]HEM5048047.1 MazG-like protein [Streptococcus suis]